MKKSFSLHGRRFSIFVSLAGYLMAGLAPAQSTNEPPQKSIAPAADAKTDVAGKSVVKIFSTLRYPDRAQPWVKKAPVSASASGVVIEGKRILTTAHAVAYASEIQIRANEAGDKIIATVEGLSPEVDLAVLKLDDESFFNTHPPLKRVLKLPQIKDAVTAYGFPAEGSSVSTTKGVVSRIDFTAMSPRIQVDAPLNPGNNGGPAVIGDEMIGLSFSPPGKAERISYITPCEDIELFLKGVREGGYHGRPMLDVVVQELQHPALRSFLGVDKSVHGIVVQQVGPVPADNPLRKWDIISQVGKTDLDDEGMIQWENGLRLPFTYLLSQTAVHGTVPMTVVRGGKPMHLDVPIQSNRSQILPGLNGAYPDYFVYGPLVFSDASQDFFYDLISGTIAGSAGVSGTMRLLAQDTPLVTRCNDFPKFEGERMVVVAAFFQHKLSESYPNPVTQVVKAINGTPIKNLSHLVEVLRDCKDKFISIEFFGRYSDTLVFPREEMLADTDQILTDNNVHNQGSPGVMTIWNAKRKE
ncbi:MAG: PDZ domain-containing protein [Limisphaerales bacterium]